MLFTDSEGKMKMRTTPGYLPATSIASLSIYGLAGLLIGAGHPIAGAFLLVANTIATVLAFVRRPREAYLPKK
ncbi:MAG: hypothetical protein V1905_00100 [bacterium]